MEFQVLENRKETKDCFSLIFQKLKNFNFYPGQYLDITLKVFGQDTKPFTISSSPTEDYLMITSKAGKSTFKKELESLKPKDTINASFPAGTFILDETEPAVFIAGGIGITPFRSMIKYAVDQNFKTPITLIYSNSETDFPFKGAFDNWQRLSKSIKVIYLNSQREGRLNQEKILKILNTKYKIRNTIFYIAGSVKMVSEIKKILLDLGVWEINIRTDEFTGY